MGPSWAASAAKSSAWIVSARSPAKKWTRASRSSGTSPSFETHLARTRAGLRLVGRHQQPGYRLRKSFGLDLVLRRCGSPSEHRAAYSRFAQARLRSDRDGLAAAAACADAAAGAEQRVMAQRPGGRNSFLRLFRLCRRLP